MTAELLNRFFIPVFLAVGFSMKLWGSRGSTDRSVRYYWLTIFSIVILIAADALESWAQRDPDLVLFRTAFTVIGYVMRPVAALSIVLIIYPKEHRPWLLWLPVLVNLAVYITAFFSPAAFSFSEEYGFVRGPLGRTVVWVSFFYIFCAVWITGKRYRKKDHIGERFILYLCAAACIAAAVIDMKTDGDHLNSAILISSIFLYMFRRSIDTINDSIGYEAGDAALREIGKCLDEISSRNVYAYRTGGDEFALLFIRLSENKVHETMERVKGLVRNRGYSISTGYAMRGGTYMPVQELIRHADEDMYANKAKYYSEVIQDRRKNRPEAKREEPHEDRADF